MTAAWTLPAETPIEELELEVIAYNVLKRLDVNTVGDLRELTLPETERGMQELLEGKRPGCGRASFNVVTARTQIRAAQELVSPDAVRLEERRDQARGQLMLCDNATLRALLSSLRPETWEDVLPFEDVLELVREELDSRRFSGDEDPSSISDDDYPAFARAVARRVELAS